MTDALSAVECAFYAFLLLPVLYLIFRHRVYGFMGWLFLSLFCILRIIGAAMSVNSASGVGSIISNVGLSPMLLATAGILHEARLFRVHSVDRKVEAACALLFHFPVVVGVALTAAGSSKLQKQTQTPEQLEKAEKLVKAGIAILTVSWGILVGWAAASLVSIRSRNAEKARVGTTLLWSIVVSLFFIGLRVFYSVVTLSTRYAYLNPTTGSMAIRVVLAFLPELIATIIYVAAGLKTQRAAQLMEQGESYDSGISQPQSAPYV